MTRHIQRPDLAVAEDEYNGLLLKQDAPGDLVVRVCMHVDRTVTYPGSGQTSTQCDYCESVVYDPGVGPVPDLMPYVYMERRP